MKLHDIFEKPVDRSIEGVIKADDDASLLLEVEEYVLTREVEKRLESFLDAYNNYDGANGVWISGFFGSGKSHLLKILALLLENRVIDGNHILDLFLPKCRDNEILRGDLKAAVAIPSKSILFNIDQKAEIISKKDVDALLSVFVKVFDEMCGYYGKQGYIAQFERDLDGRGLYAPFKEAYKEVAGQSWKTGREVTLLEGPNIAKAYARVTGTDESAAAGIIDKYRDDYKLSIEDFANQVNAFIEQQEAGFRLNFFVDEVGQYIAGNTKLMTNLQTVAESLATKCRGRAWVIVTAQEDMKNVVGEMGKKQGNDFSKIQARFNNRMKLTSANVAEVIQKRLLLKNEQGVEILTEIYHEQQNNLKTLFDFTDGSLSYRNFRDRDEFIQSYPFIPYQFTLFKAAIENLSNHNAFEGKHSSVGERSMLGVFQQVAIHIEDHAIRELATFDLMFEGIRTALKSQIQGAVSVAERNLGDGFAVRVLKALFLVKYVKSFKATVRNISILMLDNFDRNVADLQKQVQEALNLLEQQTYIQRNGDQYEFLTDEEKDVEQEIKNTDVDNAEVSKALEKIIFDHVLRTRKIRYDENGQDYPFSRRLDGALCGREQELAVNIITPLNEQIGSETTLSMQSAGKDELLVIMPADDRFYRDLVLFMQTDKYVRLNVSQTQSEAVKRILTDRQFQNREREQELQTRAKELLGQAKCIINLAPLDISATDPQEKIKQGFYDLIRRTYPNLKMLGGITYREEDIAACLTPQGATLFADSENMMSEAEQEMLSFIQGNSRSKLRTTVKTVVEKFEKKPYGWYLAAILCVLAKLCAREKIEVRSDSNILEGPALEKGLRNTAAHANLILDPQIDFTASQVRQLKDFYEDFFDTPPKSTEARPLGRETIEKLREKLQTLESLASQAEQYPFLTVLQTPITRLRELSKQEYSFFLTELSRVEDDLLDMKEDILDPVLKFMSGSAKTIFDEARTFLAAQNANFSDLPADTIQQARDLIADSRCFKGGRMQQLKKLVDTLKTQVNALIDQERKNAREAVAALKQELAGMEDFKLLEKGRQDELLQPFTLFEESIKHRKIIAVIRESVRTFKENDFLRLLAQKDRWIQEQKRQNDNDNSATYKPGNQENNKNATKEPEPEYVSKNNIPVEFGKSILKSEADVENYVKAVREAYLAAINEGKRVQI